MEKKDLPNRVRFCVLRLAEPRLSSFRFALRFSFAVPRNSSCKDDVKRHPASVEDYLTCSGSKVDVAPPIGGQAANQRAANPGHCTKYPLELPELHRSAPILQRAGAPFLCLAR